MRCHAEAVTNAKAAQAAAEEMKASDQEGTNNRQRPHSRLQPQMEGEDKASTGVSGVLVPPGQGARPVERELLPRRFVSAIRGSKVFP